MITDYLKNDLLTKLNTDIQQIALATDFNTITNLTDISTSNQKYIASSTNTITNLGIKCSLTIDKITANNSITSITGNITANSFDVVSTSGFSINDKILVKNNYYKISNILGNTITISGNFIDTPSINDTVQQIITQLHLVRNTNESLFVESLDLIKTNSIVSINALINTLNIKATVNIQDSINFIPNPVAPTNLSYNISGNNLIISWDNMNVQKYEYELVNSTAGITPTNLQTIDYTDPFYGINTNLTYTFKVKSINRTKSSGYSNISIKFYSLVAFYFKTIDFSNNWKGTLYAKNINTGNEYIVDTNVSMYGHWVMPRTSKDGKYIAYHTSSGGGYYDFKIKNLETNQIIYSVNDTSGNFFFCNWWANDSDRITNLYRNITYTISTNTLDTTSPHSSFYGEYKHIVTNKPNNVVYYFGSSYNYAMKKRDLNGSNFAFVTGGDYYYKSLFCIDENEEYIYYGGSVANDNRIYKLNLTTGVENVILQYYTLTDYVDGLGIGRVIDNKFYVNHKIGTDYYLKYINLSDNSLNLVEQNNNMRYLCDVNKLNPSYFP